MTNIFERGGSTTNQLTILISLRYIPHHPIVSTLVPAVLLMFCEKNPMKPRHICRRSQAPEAPVPAAPGGPNWERFMMGTGLHMASMTFSCEFHHPNWLSLHHFFTEVGIPPTNQIIFGNNMKYEITIIGNMFILLEIIIIILEIQIVPSNMK